MSDAKANEQKSLEQKNENLGKKKIKLDIPNIKLNVNYKDKNVLLIDIDNVCSKLFLNINEESLLNGNNFIKTKIQGGITNLLYMLELKDKIKYKNNNICNKKLLVRIYGENTEYLIDRPKDELLFYELGTLNFGPKLYGIFGNGRVEQFYDDAHSVLLHKQEYYDKISVMLSVMHSIEPELLKNDTKALLWDIIQKWYKISSNITFNDIKKNKKYNELGWNNILKQINIMKSVLISDDNGYNVDKLIEYFSDKCNIKFKNEYILGYKFMTESVFCHNDLLGGNVLYLKDKNEIKFVDFEYGSYNFRGFDFANHFCEYPGFDCNWERHFPTNKHIKEYITIYIDNIMSNKIYKNKLINNPLYGDINKKIYNIYINRNTIKRDEYELFINGCLDIILLYTTIDNYFWGLWAVVQAKYSPVNFDFLGYAHDRLINGYKFCLTKIPSFAKIFFKKVSKV